MALITILTPTYNRGANLEALFLSLQSQISINFEWLIVDDGSTDDTYERVVRFTHQAPFPVRYLKKENGGKHTAINKGIQHVETELVFIVDSDDELFENAISVIEEYYHKYKNVPGVGVWSFLRCHKNRGVLLRMPKDEFVGSYVVDRVRNPMPGDMAEVFLTSALKEFPFPEFTGEKFLSEDVVWIPLGIKYKTVFINQPIYIFEYLDHGLTRNDKRYKFASPLGSMMRGKMLMKKECGLTSNIRGAIIYSCYRRVVKEDIPDLVRVDSFRERAMTWGAFPVSLLFYWKWKREAKI